MVAAIGLNRIELPNSNQNGGFSYLRRAYGWATMILSRFSVPLGFVHLGFLQRFVGRKAAIRGDEVVCLNCDRKMGRTENAQKSTQ